MAGVLFKDKVLCIFVYMDNKERIERITELKSQLLPLREEQQVLQLKQYLKMSTPEENRRLLQLVELSAPLTAELETKMVRYFVSYKGELTDIHNHTRYWSEPVVEIISLSTYCDIEALNEAALQLDGFSGLMNEITEMLYIRRFNRFEVMNIKRIKS
jgi:hypothetical protein